MFKNYKSITIKTLIVASLCFDASSSIMADEYNGHPTERQNHNRQHNFIKNIEDQVEQISCQVINGFSRMEEALENRYQEIFEPYINIMIFPGVEIRVRRNFLERANLTNMMGWRR